MFCMGHHWGGVGVGRDGLLGGGALDLGGGQREVGTALEAVAARSDSCHIWMSSAWVTGAAPLGMSVLPPALEGPLHSAPTHSAP